MPAPRPTPTLASDVGSTVVAAVRRARDRLVVQPRPDALGVAQVVVLPLLAACGVEVDDLDAVRGAIDGPQLCYRVRVADSLVSVTVDGVGQPLARSAGAAHPWQLRGNGGEWSLALPDETPYGVSLYDEGFGLVWVTLFGASGPDAERRGQEARRVLQEAWLADALARLAGALGPDRVRRVLRGGEPDVAELLALLREHRFLRDRRALDEHALRAAVARTLRVPDLGAVRAADPLRPVAATDLTRHAEEVAGLHGHLRVRLDERTLPVTSRAALYYVLASVAVERDRADAVPGRDLVRPPGRPAPDDRVRPLGAPGWFLRLDGDRAGMEAATADLMAALGLTRRLRAEQRGRAYPAPRRRP